MSQTEPETIPESDDDANERLKESAAEAWAAAGKAFEVFVLVLAILFARAVQALFTLARPAAHVACVVAAGYTSVKLFQTVLVRYEGDLPAIVLALAAVTLIPAALIIMAESYGIWGIMLAVAAVEFLAHLGLQRAPPVILALVPVLALASLIMHHLTYKPSGTHVPESQNEEKSNETATRQRGTTVAGDNQPDHLHGDTDGALDHDNATR